MIMEAKELRIGNYFRNVETKVGSVCTSTDISDIENGYKKREGIPLTEEWLLKLGFILKNKTHSINVGGELIRYAFFEEITEERRILFIIYFCKRNGWTLDPVVSKKETYFFKHVHELQNIFFTNTGKELQCKQQ